MRKETNKFTAAREAAAKFASTQLNTLDVAAYTHCNEQLARLMHLENKLKELKNNPEVSGVSGLSSVRSARQEYERIQADFVDLHDLKRNQSELKRGTDQIGYPLSNTERDSIQRRIENGEALKKTIEAEKPTGIFGRFFAKESPITRLLKADEKTINQPIFKNPEKFTPKIIEDSKSFANRAKEFAKGVGKIALGLVTLTLSAALTVASVPLIAAGIGLGTIFLGAAGVQASADILRSGAESIGNATGADDVAKRNEGESKAKATISGLFGKPNEKSPAKNTEPEAAPLLGPKH